MYCRGELVFEGACANLASNVQAALFVYYIVLQLRGELVSEGECANLAASVVLFVYYNVLQGGTSY